MGPPRRSRLIEWEIRTRFAPIYFGGFGSPFSFIQTPNLGMIACRADAIVMGCPSASSILAVKWFIVAQ